MCFLSNLLPQTINVWTKTFWQRLVAYTVSVLVFFLVILWSVFVVREDVNHKETLHTEHLVDNKPDIVDLYG